MVDDVLEDIDEQFDELNSAPGNYGGVSPFGRRRAPVAQVDAPALVGNVQLSPNRQAQREKLMAMVGQKAIAKRAAEIQATKTPQYKGKQLLGMLALAALPTLIGAMKGRRGLEVGGYVGAQASSNYLQSVRADQEREALRAQLEADQHAASMAELNKMLLKPEEAALQREEDILHKEDLKGRGLLNTGTNITIEDKSVEAAAKAYQNNKMAEIEDYESSGGDVMDASLDIVQQIDVGIANGYWKANENVIDARLRNFLASYVETGSPAAQLQRDTYQRLLNALALVKGNANEREFDVSAQASASAKGVPVQTLRHNAMKEVNTTASKINRRYNEATGRRGLTDPRTAKPVGAVLTFDPNALDYNKYMNEEYTAEQMEGMPKRWVVKWERLHEGKPTGEYFVQDSNYSYEYGIP